MPAGGYFGRALVVDVTDGAATTLPLPDRVLRAYLGGAGLGTWLLHRCSPRPMAKTAIVSGAGNSDIPRGDDPPYPPQGASGPHDAKPRGYDPLGPQAPLAFVFSPLVGTPLTTSAKFAVVAKSPLTGLLTDALASSQFAIAGKLTGHDAIVVTGRAQTPSVLLIDGDGARLDDAADLAGLTAADADRTLRDRLGRGWRVAAIGPAGERGVRYATISHDGRHAGRGGLGAVMGAKNLKAIAVRAATKVTSSDPAAVLAAARDLRERSFGPATAKYRELGTLANLLAFNAISALPTRNFQSASFEGAVRLGADAGGADAGPTDHGPTDHGSADHGGRSCGPTGPGATSHGITGHETTRPVEAAPTATVAASAVLPSAVPASTGPADEAVAGPAPANLAEMRRVARSGCASCTIGCEHIYRVGDGKKARVEYENVFALGPMCGVAEPEAVLAASARCDDLGIDTISAGGTIAWAMECAERGLIDAPWLRFGDPQALLRALDEIGGMATPLGRLLAQGSRAAAITVGAGSGAFAPHVKGLEMPGYEPRTLHAMALGLAVNARGADHNRSGAYEADLSGDLDRTDGGAAHVAAAIETEDRAAVMDSMILCKFLRGVFTDPFAEWAALLGGVTGWDLTGAELRATAKRIVLAKRVYNLREGWRPEDDWLPARLLEEPLTLASGREARLTPARLRAMIDGYYKERGLDSAGRPVAGITDDLGLA